MTQALLPYSDKRRIQDLERLVADLQRQSNRHIGITVLPNGQAYAPGGFVVGGYGGYKTVASSSIVPPPTDLLITPGADADDVWIEVEWNAPTTRGADQVVSYQVRYRDEGSTGAWVATSTTDTSDRIEGLIPVVTYDIEVYSVTKIGELSEPVTGQTTTLADTIPPEQVTGVSATSAIETAFVEWLPVEARDVARGGTYEVELYTDSGLTAFLTGVSVAGGTTFATIAGMVAGTQVWIRVRAVDASANLGPWSSTVTTTPGGFDAQPSDGSAPVSSPTATVRGGVGYLLVEWDEVANPDPVVYDVHLATTTGFTPTTSTLAATTPGTFAFVRTTPAGAALVYGTTYYARIIARDPDGSALVGVQGSGTLIAVTAGDLGANSVGTTQLVNDAITNAKIAAGAVGATEITDDAITTPKLAAGAIIAEHITAGAIESPAIKAGAVVAGKIAADAVSATEIAANTITATEMVAGTITAASGILADAVVGTAKIADAAITSAKIGDLQVTTAKLANALITNAKIGALAVDNAKIADATIQSAKIASITADKITTGTLTATVTISGIITTGVSGPRIDVRPEGITGYGMDGVTPNLEYRTSDGAVAIRSATVEGNLIGSTIIGGDLFISPTGRLNFDDDFFFSLAYPAAENNLAELELQSPATGRFRSGVVFVRDLRISPPIGGSVANDSTYISYSATLNDLTFIRVPGASPTYMNMTCGLLTQASSQRLKSNVKPMGRKDLRQRMGAVDVSTFDYEGRDGRTVGVIAEQLAESVPEVVRVADGETVGFDVGGLTAMTLAYAQEMERDFDARLSALENGG